MNGPTISSGTRETSAHHSTACGFPMDTKVMRGSSPHASCHPAEAPAGIQNSSGSAKSTTAADSETPGIQAGIRAAANMGAPIETVASCTVPSRPPRIQCTSRTPRRVSTRSGCRSHRPRSTANFATQRMPFPHIMPSLPSALYIRMRTSASMPGVTGSTMMRPSLPIPTCRSLTQRASAGGSFT